MMARLSRVGGGLTASRFAEHPVGEPPGQPRLVSRRSETLGWPGSVEDPRPSGCFAKRSGGGSIELLGGDSSARLTLQVAGPMCSEPAGNHNVIARGGNVSPGNAMSGLGAPRTRMIPSLSIGTACARAWIIGSTFH